MTLFQLGQGMAIVGALMAVILGAPVSAYLSFKRRPRQLVLWPLLFAAAAGAISVVIDLVGYIVMGHRGG